MKSSMVAAVSVLWLGVLISGVSLEAKNQLTENVRLFLCSSGMLVAGFGIGLLSHVIAKDDS